MNDSITCPQCGRTSHNPNDVREQYCGACYQYHDTMPIHRVRQAQVDFRQAAGVAYSVMEAGSAPTTRGWDALTEFVKAGARLDDRIDEYLDVQKLNTRQETPQREGE